MKTRAHQIKKIIDYLQLFSEVNGELISKERTKTRKTNRYPISNTFIEATECMKEILQIFKEIKVISLSEIVTDRIIELRTIYDHFYEVPSEVQKILDSSPKIENESAHSIKKAVPIIYQGHLEILKSVKVTDGDTETKESV